MKLEVVLADGAPAELIRELESKDFCSHVLHNVINHDLRLMLSGSAEFFIKKCEFACGSKPMCAVTLTGVSVTMAQATDDFIQTLEDLEIIYRSVLEKHYTVDRQCQLFVSMVLDQPPFGRSFSFLERPPMMVSP